MPGSTALLLIAHGSREEAANSDTRRLADELAQRGGYCVAVAAFLELAAPDIDAAAATCVGARPKRVVMVPHFLSSGVHVRRDLAAAQQRLAQRYPDTEFHLAEPIGCHPLLVDILAQRAEEAVET